MKKKESSECREVSVPVITILTLPPRGIKIYLIALSYQDPVKDYCGLSVKSFCSLVKCTRPTLIFYKKMICNLGFGEIIKEKNGRNYLRIKRLNKDFE